MKLFIKEIPNQRIIIAIAILAILLAGGVFAWQYLMPKTEETEGETAGWKTYRNEEYGFEVKYPDQFVLNVDSVGLVGGTNEAMGGSFGDIQGEIVAQSAPYATTNAFPALSFIVFPSADVRGGSYSNLKEYAEFLADYWNSGEQIVQINSNATYEEISLNGTPAYKIKYCVYGDCFETDVYVQSANKDVIRFHYSDEVCMGYKGIVCGERSENTFADTILSTFKFLASEELGKPYIQVVSPNGGEKLRASETYTIRWSLSDNNVKNVIITLLEGASRSYLLSPKTGVDASSGKFEWKINSNASFVERSNLRIVLYDTGYCGYVSQDVGGECVKDELSHSDVSDNYFSIVSPNP